MPLTTNQLLDSSDTDGTAWAANGVTSTEAVSVFLNGIARTVAATGGVAAENVSQVAETHPAGPQTLWAVLERQGAGASSALSLYDGTAGGHVVLATLTWSPLSVVVSSSAAGTSPSVGYEDLGTGPNGAQLVLVYATGTATVGNSRVVYLYVGGTGTSTAGAIVHHAQLEETGSPSFVPVRTTDATVTERTVNLDTYRMEPPDITWRDLAHFRRRFSGVVSSHTTSAAARARSFTYRTRQAQTATQINTLITDLLYAGDLTVRGFAIGDYRVDPARCVSRVSSRVAGTLKNHWGSEFTLDEVQGR